MDYFRELDAFGVQINLRFKEYKGSYKTNLGALVSLIISILILVIVGRNFDRMINMRNPNVAVSTDTMSRDTDFIDYDFRQLHYVPFIGIESANFGVDVNITEFFEYFKLEF